MKGEGRTKAEHGRRGWGVGGKGRAWEADAGHGGEWHTKRLLSKAGKGRFLAQQMPCCALHGNNVHPCMHLFHNSEYSE